MGPVFIAGIMVTTGSILFQRPQEV